MHSPTIAVCYFGIMTVHSYTLLFSYSALLRVDLPNSAVSYNRESVSIGEPLPGVTRNEPQENQESQPHESDQSQDRVEERQHGRNQLQESEDHSQNSVEESGEAAHVAFTIPDGDDEPESVSVTFSCCCYLILGRLCQ